MENIRAANLQKTTVPFVATMSVRGSMRVVVRPDPFDWYQLCLANQSITQQLHVLARANGISPVEILHFLHISSLPQGLFDVSIADDSRLASFSEGSVRWGTLASKGLDLPSRVMASESRHADVSKKGVTGGRHVQVVTGLGEGVDHLIRRYAPHFQDDLLRLQREGWTISYASGERLKGVSGASNSMAKTIRISEKYKGDEIGVLPVLAHEVGHALDKKWNAPKNSKEAYLQYEMRREGRAVFYEYRVRREMKENGGPSLTVNALGHDASDQTASLGLEPIEEIYARYLGNGNLEQAAREVADLLKNNLFHQQRGRAWLAHYERKWHMYQSLYHDRYKNGR